MNASGYRTRDTPRDTVDRFSGYDDEREIATQLTIGRRGFRALTPRAVRYTTIGLSGGHAYGEASDRGQATANFTDWTGGLVIDLGGAYFMRPGLSLGGSIGFGAAYTRGERNVQGGAKQTVDGVRAGLDGGQLLLTIHFWPQRDGA